MEGEEGSRRAMALSKHYSARVLGTRLPATGVIWALRAQSRKKVRK